MGDGLLGGFDPAQLQALLAQFSPSADDEKAARSRALMAAGLAIMGARKGQEWQAVGNAGLLGLNARDQYMQEQQQRRMAQMVSARGLMDLQQQMQAAQDDATYRKTMAERAQGLAASPMQQPPVMMGQPTAQGEMSAQPSPPSAAPRLSTSKMSDYQRAIADAQYLEAKGVAPKYVEQAYAKAEKLRPELSRQESLTDPQSGQRVRVNFYKDGSHEVLPFAPDAEKAHFLDTGSQVGAVDPFTGKPITGGGLYNKTATPGEVASDKRGWAQINQAERHFNISQGSTKTSDLRKEFNALPQVKAYGEVQPVLQSAREAVGTNTAAADLNLIYAAAKIMDPTSVVRESETTMVVNSGSPAQRFMGQFNYVAGGGRLTPEARKSLMNEVESRGRGYESSYKAARKTYEGLAQKSGIPSDQVFIEPFAGSEQANQKQLAATGGLTAAEAAELAALKKKYGR